MSPPIRDGSGNSIGSIRLGDGSEISEVRTGAGDVLFGAAPAIPDSGDLQARYDWTEASGTSTVADQTGNGYDLTGTYTGPTASINGNQAGEFDGVGDILDVTFPNESQPNHVFVVAELRSVEARFRHIIDSPGIFEINIGHEDNRQNWRMVSGKNVISSTAADTTPHIFNGLFDGANSELRVDGSSILSDDVGTSSMTGVTVGARGDSAQFTQINIGEVLIYPQDKSSVEADVEQYLSDKWGVTI